MDHFYTCSIAIIVVTLFNLFLASKMKNSWFKKIGLGLNFLALVVLMAAIIFRFFHK